MNTLSSGIHSSSRFRADIQGLRAIAVIAVIADHFLKWPSGGFVGVDIFFVISGFLITGLLVREYEDKGTISFVGFYTRRVKRIMPAAVFVLGATVCASYALWGLGRTKDVLKDAVACLFFVGNWRFAQQGVDYFRQDIPPSPLQHFWSLSVEEQFYFVWPWLMLGVLALGSRFFSLKKHHTRHVAGWAIAVVCLVSMSWAFHETSATPRIAYFSTLSRVWELGAGAIIAIGWKKLSMIGERLAGLLGWAGLTGIVASLFFIDARASFPAPWALLPVASVSAVIIAGAKDWGNRIWLLNNAGSQHVGNISYGLYLWHFPVVIFLPTLLVEGTVLYYATGLVVMLALSVASFRLLEDPARKGDWFAKSHKVPGHRPSRGCVWFGGACLGTIALSCAANAWISTATRSIAKPISTVLVGMTEVDAGNCFGAAAMDPRHHCASLNPEKGIQPRTFDILDDKEGAYDCYMPAGGAFRSCSYGSDKPGAMQVALIGDSHAASLIPAIRPQLDALNWHLTVFVGNGCQLRSSASAKNCSKAMPRIMKELSRRRFALIIATQTRKTKAPLSDYVSVTKPLLQAGQKIVVVEDNPRVSPETVACIGRVGNLLARNCATPEAIAFGDEDYMVQAAKEMGIPVVSLRQFYCKGNSCPAVIGNTIVYRDTGGHITGSWAKTLSPYLTQAIVNASSIGPGTTVW